MLAGGGGDGITGNASFALPGAAYGFWGVGLAADGSRGKTRLKIFMEGRAIRPAISSP